MDIDTNKLDMLMREYQVTIHGHVHYDISVMKFWELVKDSLVVKSNCTPEEYERERGRID